MKSTKWYKSWTLWANVLAGFLITVQELADLNLVSGTTAAVIVIVVNFILRFKTDSEITS